MAVQVSFTPGIYIEEFTPGAPIQGVGTSTAALIGTAWRGPINEPTLIHSWDEFVRVFGGFGKELPQCYLAPGVYGFFLNGGAACYVMRIGTGQCAELKLLDRAKTDPKPVLVVRTPTEASGDHIEVAVQDSSYLAAMLGATNVDGFKDKNYLEVVSTIVTIAQVADNRVLTVPAGSDFAPGDRVILEKQDNNQTYTYKSTVQTVEEVKTGNEVTNVKITLKDALSVVDAAGHEVDFTNGTVRMANLELGQRELRLKMPKGWQTHQLLPVGSTVEFRVGDASENNNTEIHLIEAAYADKIRLKAGLAQAYALDDSSKAPQIRSWEFSLIINNKQALQPERFEQLSMHSDHPNFWQRKVKSDFVMVEASEPPRPQLADPRPAVVDPEKPKPLTGGQADAPEQAWNNFKNAPSEYLNRLKTCGDIALVCIPGATDPVVQQALRDHCETMADRFALLDSALDDEPSTSLLARLATVQSSKGYAALYYPWIQVRNPATGNNEFWPPSGHIAGAFARSDGEVGVHKAPANLNLRGALGLKYPLTDEQQSPLNEKGINVLRVFPGQAQPLIWGARTTAPDRNWQYVNIRRLFIFLEKSIQEGIRWAVFAPNNLQLWQKVKRTITEFLTRVWRSGALFGATAEQAFYVRIDDALNPPSEQKLGRLNIEIGVRPTYAAEFIVVRIGIWDGGAQVSE